MLVLAATFYLYAPAVGFQFVYDDSYQIVQNPHVHSWHFLPVYFTQSIWSQLASSDTNLYRPLFLVWLRLNMAVFGEEPSGWHLTTVLLHVLATGLVYLLARSLLKNHAAALMAAMLFGVHPIHTEPVAWVSGVPEPLSGALFLGSLLCYLRLRRQPQGRWLWLTASVGLFAAAVLVKETAAVLPVVIATYELTVGGQNQPPENSSRVRQVSAALTPYLGVLIFYFVARAFAMGGLHPGTVPWRTSLLSWPWLLWTYIKMLVWPAHLSPSYDFPYVERFSQAHFLVPVAGLLAGVVVLWLWSRRDKSKMAMFLGAWFLVTLAPAMAAFCLAYAEESVHDRYLYLPSFALALLAGAAFTRLCSHGSPLRMSLACGLAGAMLAGLAVCTHRQMRYWESNYALFQRATEIAPQNERAAMNFVAELMKRKEYGRALGLCQAMIKLNPESERPVGSAALVSFLIHDYAGAEKYYVQASRLDPSQGNLFYFLGLTRLRLGDYKGAANALRTAVDLSSRAPFFHYTLGVALAQLQEWPEAREQFSQEVGIQTPASFELAQQALRDADRHLREKTRILKQAEPANLDLPGVPN